MITRIGAFLAATAAIALSVHAQNANAQILSGPTVKGNICMQKVFMAPATTVSGSNRLNCTANDIRLSGVKTFSPETCNRGERFPLTATFVTKVTASNRYDAGFFFRTDGGPNARGDGSTAAGECSLSALTVDPAIPEGSPALKTDGDTAGDLNSNVFPGHEVTFTIPNVLCEGAINPISGKEELKLPNCTSWHNTAALDAFISNPFNVDNAFGFKPDTKSKCVCDDNFTVPVVIQDASIRVTKVPSTNTVNELGAAVIFTATLFNESSVADIIITSIDDVLIDGNGDPIPLTGENLALLSNNPACGAGQPSATSPGPCTPAGKTSCPSLLNTTLAADSSATCDFAMFISGDFGDSRTDKVTICGMNPDKPTDTPCESGVATVAVNNTIGVEPSVVKTAVSAECDVTVNYRISVTNNSAVDSLTVGTLIDEPFGNIRNPANPAIVSTTCATIPVIGPGGVESCTFVAKIASKTCNVNHTNEITVTAEDDDGEDFVKKDTATVDVKTTFP